MGKYSSSTLVCRLEDISGRGKTISIGEVEVVKKVGLVGNPNVGKSVIFNELTGGRAWVGNWPGVTVEKKVGRLVVSDMRFEIIDLPGIYGLTAYSIDEMIARNFIVNEKPDLIVNIVNAANIERNLYLTISLLEMGANIVVALNMMDLAEEEGYSIDVGKLSEELGVPVVPMVAIKKLGFRELIDELVKRSLEKRPHIKVDIVDYGPLLEEKIRDVEKLVSSYLPELASIYVPRWIAIKLLERDPEIEKKIAGQSNGLKIIREVNKMRQGLQEELGVDIEEYIIEKRYAKVSEILRKVLVKKRALRTTLTDLVDFIVTHRIFGIPVMLTIFYMMFQFAFTVATPLSDLIDFFFSNILYTTVQNSVLPGILKSLIADVIITGIGSILVFLPNIAFLFLALAVLEDVGYMSRAAFVVDKLMHKLGLTGKAIIPMIIGFGCNVPAVMATRTIEDENDRKTAVLINPLMSCSARLPVYLILAGAFFAGYASSIVLTMYILGVVLAVGVAVFLRKLVFKAPSSGFIMELPPYMVPMMSNIGVKTWERTKKFLFKAGTVILLGVLLTWALSVYGPNGYIGPESLENPRLMEKSWVGVLGHALEKVFWPMGWDWRAAAALFFGFIAKEVVVGTMAMLYGVGEGELPRVISTAFTPTTAYAYMAFVLIYVPCLATMAAIRGELGLKYAIITLIYEITLAYLVALTIVGLGHIMGLP